MRGLPLILVSAGMLMSVPDVAHAAPEGSNPDVAGMTDEQIAAYQATLDTSYKRQKERIQAVLDARKKAKARADGAHTPSAKGLFEKYSAQYRREKGYLEEILADKQSIPPTDECNPQKLFIRADSLDNYLYGITPASKAKGASVGYTDDHVKSQTTATIGGMVSYVLFRDLCPTTPLGGVPFVSAYALAPFVNAQGNYTQPMVKTEHSSLQFGVEGQLEFSQLVLPRQVITASPFYQTDFRGIAQVTGVNVYWDPYDADMHLGGYINTNPYLGWFVQVRGQASIVNVSDPGLTNLSKTDYEWVGGTARLNMYFFPLAMDVSPQIRNRFSFIATADFFHDVRSGMDIRKYTAALKYKISEDGSSSIAFEYDRGTDKDTLTRLDQYLIKLTYAY